MLMLVLVLALENPVISFTSTSTSTASLSTSTGICPDFLRNYCRRRLRVDPPAAVSDPPDPYRGGSQSAAKSDPLPGRAQTGPKTWREVVASTPTISYQKDGWTGKRRRVRSIHRTLLSSAGTRSDRPWCRIPECGCPPRPGPKGAGTWKSSKSSAAAGAESSLRFA